MSDGGELIVVLEGGETLIPERGVHSGWEIDVRKPIPVSLQHVNGKLPSRVFGCHLMNSADSYTLVKPLDDQAKQLPDEAFCFCAGSVGSDGNVSEICRHQNSICQGASDVSMDLFSPLNRPIHLPNLTKWSRRLQMIEAQKFCGDGQVDIWEACDDGNQQNRDGCQADCRKVDVGYTCVPGSPCYTTCGDGILAGSEECDDGNVADHDGCSGTCKVEVQCARKESFEKFRRPPAAKHTIFSQNLQMNLNDPVMYEPVQGSLHAPVPIIDGSAKCGDFSCPAGCLPKAWVESYLCVAASCRTSDVKQCCDCGNSTSQPASTNPSTASTPCFSWKVATSGVSPSASDLIASCGGARGYVFAALKDGDFQVRHDVLLDGDDVLARALTLPTGKTAKVTALSSNIQSLRLKTQTTAEGVRFGFYCAGSDDECQLWQVMLEANMSQTTKLFKASQNGGARASLEGLGLTFAIYKVANPEQIWDCFHKLAEPQCGDGFTTGLEECDAVGGLDNYTACNISCKVSEGWGCTPTNCSALCGDHLVLGNETCDDGSTFKWGGCSNDCKFHTQLSYLPYNNSCAGQDAEGYTRKSYHGLDSLNACQQVCSAKENCSACEWYPSGRNGTHSDHCYLFFEPTPTSFGSGPKFKDAQCYVKVRYTLLTEGVETLTDMERARSICQAQKGDGFKNMELVSIKDVVELEAVYKFVSASGHDLNQSRGVPIGWAINHDENNSYFDLTNASSGLDALLATAYSTGQWQTNQWMTHSQRAEAVGFGWGDPNASGWAGFHDWPHEHYPSGIVCEYLNLSPPEAPSKASTIIIPT